MASLKESLANVDDSLILSHIIILRVKKKLKKSRFFLISLIA